MLLNEVQKQRRLVKEHRTTIQELKTRLAAMTNLEARLARLEAALSDDHQTEPTAQRNGCRRGRARCTATSGGQAS